MGRKVRAIWTEGEVKFLAEKEPSEVLLPLVVKFSAKVCFVTVLAYRDRKTCQNEKKKKAQNKQTFKGYKTVK